MGQRLYPRPRPPVATPTKTADIAVCAYCRRVYHFIPSGACDGCGAAEWKTKSEFMRGFVHRNLSLSLTSADREYLRTGKWI